MVELAAAPVLTRIAGSLLVQLGKWIHAKASASSPIARAASSTAEHFGDVEAIRRHLELWTASASFEELLRRVETGDEIEETDLLASFTQASDYYDPDGSSQVPARIVAHFVRTLEVELLSSADGRRHHEIREQLRHEATSSQNEQTLRTLDEEVVPKLDQLLQLHADARGADTDQAANAKLDTAKGLLDRGHTAAAEQILREVEFLTSSQLQLLGSRTILARLQCAATTPTRLDAGSQLRCPTFRTTAPRSQTPSF